MNDNRATYSFEDLWIEMQENHRKVQEMHEMAMRKLDKIEADLEDIKQNMETVWEK